MYRLHEGELQFLLVHPGGPFWKNKDAGSWTIPKGEPRDGEDLLATAKREFVEELGIEPHGRFHELAPIKQKGGKQVHAWAFKGDCDPAQIRSNVFQIEWPPRSGRQASFPEVDRAAWFGMAEAVGRINPAQVALLEQIPELVK